MSKLDLGEILFEIKNKNHNLGFDMGLLPDEQTLLFFISYYDPKSTLFSQNIQS